MRIFTEPLLVILIFCGIQINAEFTAISCNWYALQLYTRVETEDAPSESDPAFADASFRYRLCEDITSSGFFYNLNLDQVNMWTIGPELQNAYPDIFQSMYSRRRSANVIVRLLFPFEYTNAYISRSFEIRDSDDAPFYFTEHVFTCLLRSWYFNIIVPYYVTKEYDIGFPGRVRKAGRFLILDHGGGLRVSLAEEPAEVYTSPDFNVELRYLQRRKYREPADRVDLDPVCRLVPENVTNNQHARLCAIVLKSAHFKGRVYPDDWSPDGCAYKQLTFKSEEAIEEAAGKSYYEHMVCCHSRIEFDHVFFYISRAYKSNEVFVYHQHDYDEGLIHLENLTVNVSIVQEPLNFDDVE